MAKAIKTAIIAVVVAVVVIYGGALLLQAAGQGVAFGAGAAGAAGTLAATSSVLTIAATTFVGTLVAAGIGAMSSRGADFNTTNFGTKTSSRQAIAPRQLVYGTCRVGGTIVHMETTGTNNTKLCMIVVLAGHPIDGLASVRIGDVNATTTSSTVSGETTFRVTNSTFINSDNDNAMTGGTLIRFTFHDGTQTARDGLAAATLGSTSIPTTHKYINCAYVYLEMVYDAEALPNIPQLSFVVRGKNVFDPRTNAAATTNLQRQNPALQVRDFLTDTVYGMRATSSEINDTTNAGGFAAAANTCDQTVTLSDGSTTERRYTSSGFTNFSATGESVLSGLQSAMGGRLSYTNGVFNLFAGAAQTPTLTITDDDLLAPVGVDTGSGGALGDLYNRVKGVYVSASGDFKGAETPTVSDATMLSHDTPSGESSNNYKKTLEVQLPYTTTETMAQRLARIQLRYQRKTLMVTVTVPMTYMRLQPNDFVRVTNERLSFTNKLFEVQSVEMTLAPEETGAFFAAVALVLREISSDVWDFATNEYSTSIGEGSVVNTGSLSVAAPTIGTLVQRATIQGPHTIIDIIVPWTNQQDDAIQGTEIQYKVSSESDFAVATVAGKGQTKGVIQNVVVGNTYNVRLRHFSFDNVYSGFSSTANITIAESDTLAQPSSVSATTGKPFFIELKWTNPANTNLRAVEVHASLTSGFTPSTGTLVNTYYGDVGKDKRVILGKSSGFGFEYTTTAAPKIFFFRLRAINVFGTATAFTSQVSGSFTKALSADIDTISANQLTAGTIDAGTITVDNIDAAKITANTLAVSVMPSTVVFESELTDGTTIIDGSNILSGTITLSSNDATNDLAHIKGGKTSYEDTSNEGFFMGFNSNNHPSFNIGTTTDFLKYDQTSGLTLRGTLTAGDIASGGTLSGVDLVIGSGTSVFKATTSGLQLGNDTFGSAPFRVTPQGALTSTSGSIGGFTLGATSLIAGANGTRVSLSTADGIHLGHNTFSNAPFRVDRAGNLTATSVTVTGSVFATGGETGPLTTNSTKLFLGTGTFNNSNTGFYVDEDGNFSLKDKLVFDGTDLSVSGSISATSLSLEAGVTIGYAKITGGPPSDIGGLTISSTQLHHGTGTFGNANTGFLLNADGKFSLKDKLTFDGTDLTVSGGITATTLSLTNSSQGTIATALGGTNTAGASGSLTDSASAATLYNDNGVLKVRSGSLSGVNHMVQESTLVKRFSNDKDFIFFQPGSGFTEIADLWYKLDDFGGPVQANDVVIVRAGANAYLATSAGGNVSNNASAGIYSAKCTLQLGTAVPETSSGFTAYGGKVNNTSIENDNRGHSNFFSSPRGIEGMRYELRLTSSGIGSQGGDGSSATSSYYRANSINGTSAANEPDSSNNQGMDKRIHLLGRGVSRLEMVDSIKSADAQTEDSKSHHGSGGRYNGLRTGSNYAYFRLWIDVAVRGGQSMRFIDPYIEVTIVRNSNDQAAS